MKPEEWYTRAESEVTSLINAMNSPAVVSQISVGESAIASAIISLTMATLANARYARRPEKGDDAET